MLTVGQALERFSAAGRKAPSGRTIQRYCDERRLEAKKIRTVFGSEWLINETSLARLIESEPIISGDAGVANSSDVPPSATPTPPNVYISKSDTDDIGVAGDAMRPSMASPVGERRTIAEVLIENARLLAQVEGRDAIISELKEDRSFLREEVREGRRTRDDVKNIAERMLDTLRSMAIGRAIGPANHSVGLNSGRHHRAHEDRDRRKGDNFALILALRAYNCLMEHIGGHIERIERNMKINYASIRLRCTGSLKFRILSFVIPISQSAPRQYTRSY